MGSIGVTKYKNGLFFANEKEAKVWKSIRVSEKTTSPENSLSNYSLPDSTNLSQDFKINRVRRRLVFNEDPDETDREVENIFANQIREDKVSNYL